MPEKMDVSKVNTIDDLLSNDDIADFIEILTENKANIKNCVIIWDDGGNTNWRFSGTVSTLNWMLDQAKKSLLE